MDQTVLQHIDARIAAVRDDREHGSRWLVREALLILRDLAQAVSTSTLSQEEQVHLLYEKGRTLARLRPAMAALSSAVGRVLNVQERPAAIGQAATELLQDYDTATQRMAEHARSYIRGRILTCSISGTVLDVLVACKGAIESVTVMEGRPNYEGRAMARALSQQGIAVTLITDAQAAIFVPFCQSVVVGADSILANGDVLNKAGTALLAWTAHGYRIPFYVCCETLKISAQSWPGTQESQLASPFSPANHLTILEEKEPDEVLEQPIPGVEVRNFYFDHTPFSLVTALITERGVLAASDIQAIVGQVAENERHLFEYNSEKGG